MNASAAPRNKFFITHQSANLMEDMQQQVARTGAICLLYGIKGVGKTRLVKEFINTRLKHQPVTYLNLNNRQFYLNSVNKVHKLKNLQSDVLDQLVKDSVLVIDQFERAPPEFCQKLFRHWTMYSVSHGLKLVLSGENQCLNLLSELAQQYHLKIMSVELNPLSSKESLQYLAARLCPATGSYPSLSSAMKRQLKLSEGLIVQLDQMILQYAEHIKCPPRRVVNRNFQMLLVFTILIAALLGVSFFSSHDPVEVTAKELPVESAQETNIKNDTQTGIETISQAPVAEVDQQEQSLNQESRPQVEPQLQSVSTDTTLSNEIEDTSSAVITDPQQTETDSQQKIITQSEEPLNILEARLITTQKWLQKAQDRISTIQLMSLGLQTEAEQSLITYLQSLKSKGIDLEQIYIYQKQVDSGFLYVVLYGIYPDRASALNEVKSLPKQLKANSPITRTVGGIKAEINGK